MAHVKATLTEIADFQYDNQRTTRDGEFSPATSVLLGGPGTGKTQWSMNVFPKIVAEARGLTIDEVAVILTQPAIRDSQEYAGIGIPAKQDGSGQLVTRFSLPNLLEQIEQRRQDGAKCVIIVADEISAAADDVQKLFAPLVDKYDKRLGDNYVGSDVVLIMTGNRAKDKSGSRRLLSHLPNRSAVFELKTDHPAFADWGDANGIHSLFTAIARTVDGFFADGPPTEDGQACTYRQIEQSSDYLKQREATGRFVDTITPAIELGIASFIGIEAAATFASFARQIAEGIPTAEEIFTNPLTSKVPSNPASQQFAVNRATADLPKYGPEAGNQLFDYVNRLAPDLQIIAGVKAAKAAIRAGINLNSDLANAFMAKHADLIELANIGE